MAGIVAVEPLGSQDFVVALSQTEEPVAGLLGLPEIFGDFPCQLFEPKKLDLYSTASTQYLPMGVIEVLNPPQPPERPDCDELNVVVRRTNDNSAPEILPTDESGYEFRRAVVYERSGRWFRIALRRGSAWIERENPDDFLSYPEVLMLDAFTTYLRPGWDGNLWNVPGAGMPVPAVAGWRAHMNEEIPMRITSTLVVRGQMWIRVRFETEVCGKSFGDLPTLETWLPAYRPSGATAVWFYSRGC
jgi:hypothetical protein